MQDGWGGGGEELSLSGSQWDAEEGDMWNSTASQESNSSCNSWGNASKKGPQKVCEAVQITHLMVPVSSADNLIEHFHNDMSELLW